MEKENNSEKFCSSSDRDPLLDQGFPQLVGRDPTNIQFGGRFTSKAARIELKWICGRRKRHPHADDEKVTC